MGESTVSMEFEMQELKKALIDSAILAAFRRYLVGKEEDDLLRVRNICNFFGWDSMKECVENEMVMD